MKHLLTCLALLLAPATAHGWTDEVARDALTPLPNLRDITTVQEWCPAPFEGRACTDGRTVIYAGPDWNPHTYLHEIGHVYEAQMSERDTAWFERQLARGTADPGERFADLYAKCAEYGLLTHLRGNPWIVMDGYGGAYRLLVYRRACRYLRYYTDMQPA